MKKLSILTTILFAFGLYMVPATFATGTATDSKDRKAGQSDYQQDQRGQAQGQQAQQAQPGQQGLQAQQGQQQNLMLVDNLSGTEIQNQQGEKIGEIDKVLVDVESGRVGFITMSSGGIFGMGEDNYIVPFNALEQKRSEGQDTRIGERQQVVFTLDRQKDQLREVPQGDIEQALTQQNQSREIHEHYGVSPYWEEDQSRQQRQDRTQRQDDTQRQMMPDRSEKK